MKKHITIIAIITLMIITALPARAQYNYDSYSNRLGMWLGSYTFFPEVSRQGWGIHYLNISTRPSQDRGMLQLSVDYDSFLDNANRARWNVTYGHHYLLTQNLVTYWSMGPGLKYDIYRYRREGKDKWYQRKYDRERIDWKGAAVADIGLMVVIPVIKNVATLIILGEEEIWYEINGEGLYQLPKISAMLTISF